MEDRLFTNAGTRVYPLATHERLKQVDMLRLKVTMNQVGNYIESRGLNPDGSHNNNSLIKIGAIRTGEKRPAKAGEWFISGAIPEAYRMPNDSTVTQTIAKLITYRLETVVKVVEIG
jgi:hypothetical protein